MKEEKTGHGGFPGEKHTKPSIDILERKNMRREFCGSLSEEERDDDGSAVRGKAIFFGFLCYWFFMVIYGICLLLNRNHCKQVLYSSNVINLGLCYRSELK